MLKQNTTSPIPDSWKVSEADIEKYCDEYSKLYAKFKAHFEKRNNKANKAA